MIMSKNEKTVVLYQSKTGYTKKYAVALAERLNCTLLEGSKVSVKDLSGYDTIFVGGGIYAGGINGAKLLTGNYEQLKNKQLILFAVGSSPVKEEVIDQLRKQNIPAEQQSRIKLYYLRGGFDYSKLSGFYKFMMSLMKKQLHKLEATTPEADQIFNDFSRPKDFTDLKALDGMLSNLNA